MGKGFVNGRVSIGYPQKKAGPFRPRPGKASYAAGLTSATYIGLASEFSTNSDLDLPEVAFHDIFLAGRFASLGRATIGAGGCAFGSLLAIHLLAECVAGLL